MQRTSGQRIIVAGEMVQGGRNISRVNPSCEVWPGFVDDIRHVIRQRRPNSDGPRKQNIGFRLDPRITSRTL